MRQELLPKFNAKCSLCGTDYYVCLPCVKNRDKGIYGWKLYTCCHECYQIKTVLDMYKDGMVGKERVAEVVNDVMKYIPTTDLIAPYDEIYAEAMGEPKTVEEEEEKTEEVEEKQTNTPVQYNGNGYPYNKKKHGRK